MIEIRIRHIDNLFDMKLGNFYAHATENAVDCVRKYGTYYDGERCKFATAHFIPTGLFKTKTYLEIIVEPD